MSLATTMILLALQIITSFFFTTTTALSPQSFTIDLIHHRSNSSSSRESRILLGSPYADTVFVTSSYLMKLQIGTPPFEIVGVLDTGSDIIWSQCLPCPNCYNQAPIFDPSKSSTYKAKNCNGKPCGYGIIYADRSCTKGTLATETVMLHSTSGQPFVLAETIIGCGHDNSGISPDASGIVGLNWGPLSLISQMGEKFLGLISYCFSGQGTSKLNFGGNALVAGDGTVATDIFRKIEKPSFYYLNLDAVSVGETRIETVGTPFHASDGNIFIDSGTTYTYLPRSYCNQVNEAVKNVVKADQHAPGGEMLCYDSHTIDIFPVITMHFAGGADLVLDRYNTYMDLGGFFCFTIMCVDPPQDAVFGNRAQHNFLVGYDTTSQLVSFKPTDCAALWS